MSGQTLYDKLWSSHLIDEDEEGVSLIYVDRQLLHEVSSPQAFQGLRARDLGVHRAHTQMAVADHSVPTRGRDQPIADPLARAQVELLVSNARHFGVRYLPMSGNDHGIVHVIGPEMGFTQPGITLVCGDSHTSTHGAFGALAFGIGASECECVLATQTIRQTRARNMRVCFDGTLPEGVYAKDMALALIGRIGASGATGYAIEYCGSTIRQMSMPARMTLCNMSIEAGSRTGLVAPDEATFAWLHGRPLAPAGNSWDAALAYWKTLPSDGDAQFDLEVDIDTAALMPQVTWGTSPDQVVGVTGRIPELSAAGSVAERDRMQRALDYMGLHSGQRLQDVAIDHVFIGSCTNSRLEDLRAAAGIVGSGHVASGVRAIVVPGSAQVKRQAEEEGLDRIFTAAGFEWRSAGCSLCVAMNDDRLPAGARCASTSNRNFEGRQGVGARTHLMSPAMAAAAALRGRIADVRDYLH